MIGLVGTFVDRFRSLGLTGSPCSVEEVAALERWAGLPLPAAYQAYLLIAGRYPPPALVGSDCTIESLYQLRDWAVEILREQPPPFELPPSAFVFIMHQGYQFMYFLADGVADDPAVFYYHERTLGAVAKYARFSEWVARTSKS